MNLSITYIYIIIYIYIPKDPTSKSGWWLTYPPEKYEFISWDDYVLYTESHKIHVPNKSNPPTSTMMAWDFLGSSWEKCSLQTWVGNLGPPNDS
jgi:hypothetical protein